MKITDLVENSIRIYEGMMIHLSQFNVEDRLHIKDLTPKFNGTFSMNNSTVAFVWEEMLYVTPFTNEVIVSLSEAGLKEDFFGVPFSNGDTPVYEKDLWNTLLAKAAEQRELEFQAMCREYCTKIGVGAISDASLANCLKVPKGGIKTWNPFHNYEGHFFPVISGCLDANAVEKIGKYATNNGRVMFIYYDGSTYVTKGYGIIEELEAAGYRRIKVYVPLSNGEEIRNNELSAKWSSIIK